ncbi:MAG: hypothetical protein IJ545_07155 [Alphaproteobacteria bacterium]|nr:hypothetical protein [Alphaproteobacteria bacterium]
MSTQVIILMTDKNGQPVHFIKDKLADEQTPSQGALYILQTKVLPVYSHNFISHLEFLGCWKQSGTHYVFQCYTDIPAGNGNFPEMITGIIAKYKRQITDNKRFAQEPLQEKITFDDLIDIKGFSKGKNIEELKNGNGFYETEENLYSCSLNFPESMNFAGINIFKKGQPRGNHHHLRKIEYTYVLRGKLKAEFYMSDDKSQTKEMILEEGMLIRFLPGHHHTLTALTPIAVVLEVCPQKFDVTDIYR